MKKFTFSILIVLFLPIAAVGALKPGDPAPDFSLRDSSNALFSLSQFIGIAQREQTRGVVLSFFASWCRPCREELPLLDSLVPELESKGIKVVIIGVKEDFHRINPLLSELGVKRPVTLSDRMGKVAELYQVRFIPITFFIDGNGTVSDILFGQIRNETELRHSMEKLLN